MITKANNKEKYAILFEKATQDLIKLQVESGEDLGLEYEVEEDGEYTAKNPITTIEQYFFFLHSLAKIGSDLANLKDRLRSAGRRYTMLPLDEETFKVDLNKRSISVPSDFNSMGAGVQGDQLCEVIYFELDRYFDAMDLNNAEIFIQWTNANGQSGLSTPYVIDIESLSNKMIIGWALSKAITEKAGNIQFSLRFYKWVDDKTKDQLSYSLGTQTATIKINNALDFKLTEADLEELKIYVEDEENFTLFDRIQNSFTTIVGNDPAAEPIFLIDLTKDNADKTYVDLLYDEEKGYYYNFVAQAGSDDTGIISYKWYMVDSEGQKTSLKSKIDYVESNDTESKEYKTYYIKEGTPARYVKCIPNNILADSELTAVEEGKTFGDYGIYEARAFCTADKVGTYYVIAYNQKGTYTPSEKQSKICVIPEPSAPAIIKTPNEDIEARIIPLEEEGKTILKVEVANEEENGTEAGELSYKWFMRNDYVASGEKPNLLDVEYTLVSSDGNNLVLEYNKEHPETVEGYYYVEITNTKNGVSRTIDTKNNPMRISYAPEQPVILPFTSNKISLPKGESITVEVDPEWLKKWNISDNIEYRWYINKLSDDEERAETWDDEDILVTGDEISNDGKTFTPKVERAGDRVACVITNIKNDAEASVATTLFSIVRT